MIVLCLNLSIYGSKDLSTRHDKKKLFSIDEYCDNDYKNQYEQKWEDFWLLINKKPSNYLTRKEYKWKIK